MLNNIKNKILKKNDLGDENTPFLFMSKNLELLNTKIYDLASDILNDLDVPKVNIFVFEDNGESIKISEIKEFLSKLNSKNPYGVQIFLIENISRFTLATANSVLKQFEEPGKGNLIFLTNKSESGVLDTILSRVQSVDLGLKQVESRNDFYIDMIKNYLFKNDSALISYFYKNKLEKIEYINFLNSLLVLIKNGEIILNNIILDDLLDDLNLISNNNVNPRGVIDKWILLIK